MSTYPTYRALTHALLLASAQQFFAWPTPQHAAALQLARVSSRSSPPVSRLFTDYRVRKENMPPESGEATPEVTTPRPSRNAPRPALRSINATQCRPTSPVCQQGGEDIIEQLGAASAEELVGDFERDISLPQQPSEEDEDAGNAELTQPAKKSMKAARSAFMEEVSRQAKEERSENRKRTRLARLCVKGELSIQLANYGLNSNGEKLFGNFAVVATSADPRFERVNNTEVARFSWAYHPTGGLPTGFARMEFSMKFGNVETGLAAKAASEILKCVWNAVLEARSEVQVAQQSGNAVLYEPRVQLTQLKWPFDPDFSGINETRMAPTLSALGYTSVKNDVDKTPSRHHPGGKFRQCTGENIWHRRESAEERRVGEERRLEVERQRIELARKQSPEYLAAHEDLEVRRETSGNGASSYSINTTNGFECGTFLKSVNADGDATVLVKLTETYGDDADWDLVRQAAKRVVQKVHTFVMKGGFAGGFITVEAGGTAGELSINDWVTLGYKKVPGDASCRTREIRLGV